MVCIAFYEKYNRRNMRRNEREKEEFNFIFFCTSWPVATGAPLEILVSCKPFSLFL